MIYFVKKCVRLSIGCYKLLFEVFPEFSLRGILGDFVAAAFLGGDPVRRFSYRGFGFGCTTPGNINPVTFFSHFAKSVRSAVSVSSLLLSSAIRHKPLSAMACFMRLTIGLDFS